MYQIAVNNKFNFEVVADQNEVHVNGKPITIDQSQLDVLHAHIIYENRSYRIEVISLDKLEKTAIIKVNGRIYNLKITDQFDQLLKQLGMDNLTAQKIAQIKAPMPGLVLNVLVADGDEVKKGDNLLVLEAMKMENMLKSPTDGVIKKIAVKQGDKVEKNELLISFS